MDSRLKAQLDKIDKQITKLFHVERSWFEWEKGEDPFLEGLAIKSPGKSKAEKTMYATASDEYKHYLTVLVDRHAEWNREKRRYELLLKAFDAEYSTFKVESQVIRRQL